MKKIVLSIILLFTISFAVVIPAFAQDKDSQDKQITVVTLPKNETVNKDYFAAGNEVVISGTVNGDAYVAGGTVIVDGVINGDLLVAGGQVTVRGKVAHNIRAVGGTVNIASDTGGNVSIAGGNITTEDSAKIAGSLAVAGGNLQFFAPTGKGATIAGGQATLASTVNGEVQAVISNLTLTPNAKVNGNLNYISSQKVRILPGATVSGKITQQVPPQPKPAAKVFGVIGAVSLGFILVDLIASFIIGALLIRFMPIFTKNSTDTAINRFGWSLLIGFLAFIIAPIGGVILLATVIGMPLALLLFIIFIILIYIGKIIVSLSIGAKVMFYVNPKLNLYIVLLIGLVIYAIITNIPTIGGIITALALFTGVGALLIQERDFYVDLRGKKII